MSNPLPEVRNPSLYFPDCHIVLSAMQADSKSLVLFRIDKVLLCRSSSVLRNLLTIPSQAEENDMYDGVLRVSMHGDSGEDLAKLLLTLYNMPSLQLRHSDPNMPLECAPLMRLAIKYNIPSLHDTIRNHFRSEWPPTLSAWDYAQDRVKTVRAACSHDRDSKLNGLYVDDMFPEPVSAIVFALQFNCPDIVPVALYQLVLTDPWDDWDAARRHPQSSELPVGRRTARWKLADKRIVMTAFQNSKVFLALNRKCNFKWIAGKPSDKCRNLEKSGASMCREGFGPFIDGSPDVWFEGADCLSTYRKIAEQLKMYCGKSICYSCRSCFVEDLNKERSKFWEKLPTDYPLV